MIKPSIPNNESTRVQALRELDIMDTPAEKEFDELTALAGTICDSPIALITFIRDQRQWFKSKLGTDLCENSRELSICGHAIINPYDILEVEDTRLDERFHDNPVTKMAGTPIIFYAGIPLTDKDGHTLGTLCVIDHKPKKLTKMQREALITLGNQVVKLLELRPNNKNLKKVEQELRVRNELLKNYAGVVSHDMKMPLANIILITDLLKNKLSEHLDKQGLQYFSYLKNSSFTLSDYISKILAHYESDKLLEEMGETFDIHHLLEEILDLLNITEDCEINLPEKNIELQCNRIGLEQILLNLLGNSLKYNDKDQIVIDIECEEKESFYYFTLTDNGIGIPEDKQAHIFELFSTVAESDRNGHKGNGIGLSTVKKLVTNMGGNITVNSQVGVKTTFSFNIEKKTIKKTA